MVPRNKKAICTVVFFTLIGFLTLSSPVFAQGSPTDNETPAVANLEECLQTALKNNRRRPASRFAVEMAEASHRQAMAGYWPQVSIQGGYQIMDEYPNYIFPASSIDLPNGGSISMTIPGLGTVPVNSITVPEQDIKLMDRESFKASIDATWLLYDGGMRKGYREQSSEFVEMMKQESRRTDLEIIDSVKRLYFGSVLATQLHDIGRDTLARMEATLDLTESMYKQGSGRVKKTDWLDNKVMVESIRSMIAQLEKNELMARAALANTMGLSWDSSLKPVDTKLPYTPFSKQLDSLVTTAYQFNPDWAKIEAGIRAAEGAVITAKSGYHPKLAITGELHKWWNDLDTGYATPRNKEGWTVGVGIEFPIFNGFLTTNKLAQARAQVAKIKEEQFLLSEGIGLQVKDTFLALKASEKSHQATLDALKAASENRSLNTRAYQHELVETEKVIRAQLTEALMSARHYKVCYDHIALQSQLNLVVGAEVLNKLNVQ